MPQTTTNLRDEAAELLIHYMDQAMPTPLSVEGRLEMTLLIDLIIGAALIEMRSQQTEMNHSL